MMNECRKSDSPIVSEKPSNKIRDSKGMAEVIEQRGLARQEFCVLVVQPGSGARQPTFHCLKVMDIR